MTTATVNLHQKLLDESIDLMDAQELKYADLLEGSDKLHKASLVLKNLNFEVENGGFFKWKDTGYAREINLVVQYLTEIGTQTALSVIDILTEFNEIDERLGNDSRSDCYCDHSEYDDEYLDNNSEVFNHLDIRYYEINDQLQIDINEWLIKLQAN